jgi:hypothetical protein
MEQFSSLSRLECPQNYEHMVLLYGSQINRDRTVAYYFNQGLEKGQLCVYATIQYRDKTRLDGIASLIDKSDEHLKKGNLMFIDLAPMYVACMCGDLDPFKEAAKQLVKLVQTRQDKHIRFFGDCAGFLFHNHHFEECLQLEAWGQERPFFGSYLCGY